MKTHLTNDNSHDDGCVMTTTTTTTTIPSNIVQDMILPYIILCIGILHGIYVYFDHIYTNETTMLFGALHVPSKEYCTVLRQQQQQGDDETSIDDEMIQKCGRSDLFAFCMVGLFVFIVLGSFGIYSLYHTTITTSSKSNNINHDPPTAKYQLVSPELRLYGYQIESQIILIVNVSYQIWDFFISLYIIPEYNDPIMLIHHIVSAIVCFCGLYNHMCSYYATFFAGFSEVSSIFLVCLDLHRYFIITPSSLSVNETLSTTTTTNTTIVQTVLSNIFFKFTLDIAGPIFVLSFIYCRIIAWFIVSKRLWDDVYIVTMKTNIAQQLRPNRLYILYIILLSNFIVSIIQIYFLYMILYEVKAKYF